MTSLAVVWAVFALPCFCAAGLITHACDGSESASHQHDSDRDHEPGCRHEGGCPEDPCSSVFTRTERQGDDINAPGQGSSTCLAVVDDDVRRLSKANRAENVVPSQLPNLPFPLSDIALLI